MEEGETNVRGVFVDTKSRLLVSSRAVELKNCCFGGTKMKMNYGAAAFVAATVGLCPLHAAWAV